MKIERELPDFIDKNGSPVRGFECTLAIRGCPGKRTLRMAKELRFDEFPGNRRAVYDDVRRGSAAAELMNDLGNQFLAGPGFALNHDRSITRRDLFNARK